MQKTVGCKFCLCSFESPTKLTHSKIKITFGKTKKKKKAYFSRIFFFFKENVHFNWHPSSLHKTDTMNACHFVALKVKLANEPVSIISSTTTVCHDYSILNVNMHGMLFLIFFYSSHPKQGDKVTGHERELNTLGETRNSILYCKQEINLYTYTIDTEVVWTILCMYWTDFHSKFSKNKHIRPKLNQH